MTDDERGPERGTGARADDSGSDTESDDGAGLARVAKLFDENGNVDENPDTQGRRQDVLRTADDVRSDHTAGGQEEIGHNDARGEIGDVCGEERSAGAVAGGAAGAAAGPAAGGGRGDADAVAQSARAAAHEAQDVAEDAREDAATALDEATTARHEAAAARSAATRDRARGEETRDETEDAPDETQEFLVENPPDPEEEHPYGELGRPLRRSSPFYIGFVGALGALVAWYLAKAVVGASQVIVLVVVSMFLAVGLNPIVERLMRRGLTRRLAVLVVTVGVLAVFVGFIAAIAPPLATQTTDLIASVPDTLESLRHNRSIERLDEQYGVIDRVNEFIGSTTLATTVFGGVLGFGKFVLGWLFSALTVLILTLYFLSSLPSIKRQAYLLAPRTRRERVQLLGDEILMRIGGYVDGALTIATIAGVSTFVFLEILGLPYALILALVIAITDLIPMVGATLGATVVSAVAFTDSLVKGVICVLFYLVYQQVENYVIYPRVMKRSVNVPPAVTVIAALIGGTMLGVVGALIAIPTAAALLLIVREVIVPRQDAT